MVYVDPLKLEAHQLSVMDVVRAVNDANLILPAGDVRSARSTTTSIANSQIRTSTTSTASRSRPSGNLVLVATSGTPKTHPNPEQHRPRRWPAIRLSAGAATGRRHQHDCRRRWHQERRVASCSTCPKQLVAKVVFDQSVFVETRIENLIHEGGDRLVLTGMMVLVFLGSMRATIGVFLSIPLSALATFFALSIGGGTDQHDDSGRACAGVLAPDRQLRGRAGKHLPPHRNGRIAGGRRRKRRRAKSLCRSWPRR